MIYSILDLEVLADDGQIDQLALYEYTIQPGLGRP